jgi:hypothetical protein
LKGLFAYLEETLGATLKHGLPKCPLKNCRIPLTSQT